MTPRRRDLGTRGRVIVASAAVGAVGALAGWMAATDHSVVATSGDASSNASANASNGSNGASTSAGASTSYDDDTTTATPGLPTQQVPSDARTGAS